MRINEEKIILPKWFDLQKYRDAELFDVHEWYWQLSVRAEIWPYACWGAVADDVLEKMKDSTQAKRTKRYQDNLNALLSAIRINPIIDLDSEVFSKFSPSHSPKPTPVVSHVSVDDLNVQLKHIWSPDREAARSALGIERVWSQDREAPSSEEVNEIFSHPITDLQDDNYPAEMLVKIRLDAPERLLIDNFTAFIRSEKNERGIDESRFRTPNFNEWHRLGLLPYLDLRIWEIQEDKRYMTLNEMADAIFEGYEVGGEETIRKSTAKLAKQVLEGNLLSILAGLAFNPEA